MSSAEGKPGTDRKAGQRPEVAGKMPGNLFPLFPGFQPSGTVDKRTEQVLSLIKNNTERIQDNGKQENRNASQI